MPNSFDLGVILIAAGLVLLLAEIAVPGFMLAVPGTLAIIYGFLVIAFPWLASVWWGPWLMAALSIPLSAIVISIYRRLSPPGPVETSSFEGLVGRTGIVVREVRPDNIKGLVRIDGDVWPATTRRDKPIPRGARVVVVGVEGVHLIVEPLEEASGSAGGASSPRGSKHS